MTDTWKFNHSRASEAEWTPGLREIYNYSVLDDGFYFVDHLVDPKTAGMAFKLFVDEALSHSQEVTIEEI